jgi:WD40 repeat protein
VSEAPARKDCYGDPLPDGAVARMGTVRCRHAGEVCLVGFLADGKTILSVGKDDTVRCWDAASGKQLRRWAAPSFRGRAALSPDRTVLAAAMDDGVCLWHAESGAEIRRLPHADSNLGAAAFSPDGRLLATSGAHIRLWDASTGARVREIAAPERMSAEFVAFLPDGKRLVSTGGRDKCALWDVATGALIRDAAWPEVECYPTAVAPDGRQLAMWGADGALRLWDGIAGKATGPLLAKGQDNPVCSLAYSPDGKLLAVGFEDGAIRLFNVESAEELRRWEGHQEAVTALAFSANGATLLSGGGDGAVRQWRTADGSQMHAFAGWQGRIRALAASPDGAAVASSGADRRVHLWDAATGREERPLETGAGEQITTVAFSADGRSVVSLSLPARAVVHAWDIHDGKPFHSFSPGERGYPAAVLAPDATAVAAGGPPDRMALLDAATGAILREYAEDGARQLLQPAAFLGPHTVAAVHSSRGSSISADGIVIWDMGTGGRELKPLPPNLGYVGRLAASPDGKVLALVGGAPRVMLWNAASAEVIRELDAGKDFILAVEFSPDGRTLATTDMDGAISLWEASTGRRRGMLRGDQGFIDALAFSPDGRRLYSGGHDGTVLAWDLTGRWRQTAPPAAPDAEALRQMWDDLAGPDGDSAYASAWALADAPEQSVPFLKDRLQRPPPTAAQIARSIAELDGDAFDTREQASEELRWADEAAEPALTAALAAHPSPEARRRIEEALDWIKAGRRGAHPPDWRVARAIEALEHAGTPAARGVLAGLAEGPETSVSREARDSLERLRRRLAARGGNRG